MRTLTKKNSPNHRLLALAQTFALCAPGAVALVGGASQQDCMAFNRLHTFSEVEAFQAETKSVPTFKTFTPDKSKQAEAFIKEISSMAERPQTSENIDKVKQLDKDGERFYQQKLIDQALTKWQEMYGMAIEIKYVEGQGVALANMARIYVDQGQWIKAKYLGENAIELLATSHDQQALAKARIALAQAYFGQDNPVWAVQQLDAALKLLDISQNKDTGESARVMYLCANLCVKFGKQKEAIRFFQESATYAAQAGDYPEAVRIRTAIVGLMIELGWFAAAQEEANKLLSIAKAAPKDSVVLQIPALQSLANAQYAAHELSAARKTYDQVFVLLAQVDSRLLSEPVKANLNNGFGFVLLATGDYEQARAHFLSALGTFKGLRDNFNQAQTANALGVLEAQDGQLAKALAYFQQSVDLHAVISPKATKLNAITSLNQACVEYRTGSFRDAKMHLEGAIAMMTKIKDYSFLSRLHEAMAEVLYKSSDLTNADLHVAKAIEQASKINDDSCLWRAYVLKAKMELTRGETEPAKESITSALSYFRSPQAGDFPSSDSIGFPVSREDMAFTLAQSLAGQGLTEAALLTCEQLKEENFITEWVRKGGQVKAEDRDVYGDLTTLRAHLHAAEASAVPSQLTKEWQAWLERFRALSTTNRSLARLIAPLPTSVQDIIAAVQKNNAVAVEYLVGPDATLAFTVDSQGRISSTNLSVGRVKLKSQVAALLAYANHAGPDVAAESERTLLASLYSELLPSGVRQFLPKTPDQMIVILPDGPLFNLPFAALIDEHGKYFVENHLLTMASSSSVLMDSPPSHNEDFSVVVAGASSSQERSETTEIANAVGPERVTTISGKQTPIAGLEEQMRGKAVMHITSKFPLSDSNPLRSVLPFAGDSADGGKTVTADKLFGSSLPSDLIVWSASSINAKDVRGNAVKIFSRGLSYAGARNVLMTLWSQPDSQKVDELVHFYQSKQAGLNPAQSLRKAQMAALSRDPSPKNWAGFQLLGPGY